MLLIYDKMLYIIFYRNNENLFPTKIAFAVRGVCVDWEF